MPGRMSQLLSGIKGVSDYTSENRKSMADLKATEQRETMNQQGIEQNALSLEQMRKKVSDSQKLGQIMAQGGDPETIYRTVLSQIGPEAAMQYKTYLADEAKAKADAENQKSIMAERTMTGQKQTFDAAEGSVAPEMALPGEVYPPAAAGAPMYQASTEQGPLPLDPVQVGQQQLTPQSAQDIQRTTNQNADATAVRTRETARQQQKAELDFAIPSAPPQQIPGRDVPLSPEVETQRARIAASGRAPAATPQEPLVAVMGPDGQPVLMKRSEAEGKRPASTREQGRAVPAGEAGKIADLDTSLNDLAKLRATIPAGATGNMAKAGAMLPDFVTNITGWGTEAKQKQGVIDRVKQVIGKALEGGVLRKEDEYKYEKILPKLADSAAVVESKLADLDSAIALRKQTALDNLDDAGYDVSKFVERNNARVGGATPQPVGGPSEALIQSNMRANPTMTRQQVIEELKK